MVKTYVQAKFQGLINFFVYILHWNRIFVFIVKIQIQSQLLQIFQNMLSCLDTQNLMRQQKCTVKRFHWYEVSDKLENPSQRSLDYLLQTEWPEGIEFTVRNNVNKICYDCKNTDIVINEDITVEMVLTHVCTFTIARFVHMKSACIDLHYADHCSDDQFGVVVLFHCATLPKCICE